MAAWHGISEKPSRNEKNMRGEKAAKITKAASAK